VRTLDVRPALVPGAGALEGGRVHGGQLQTLGDGHHRRRVLEAVRQGRADAGRGGARDHQAPAARLVKGLLTDFGGVLTTNVFDSFKAFCEVEGLPPDSVKRTFRENPEALARSEERRVGKECRSRWSA